MELLNISDMTKDKILKVDVTFKYVDENYFKKNESEDYVKKYEQILIEIDDIEELTIEKLSNFFKKNIDSISFKYEDITNHYTKAKEISNLINEEIKRVGNYSDELHNDFFKSNGFVFNNLSLYTIESRDLSFDR